MGLRRSFQKVDVKCALVLFSLQKYIKYKRSYRAKGIHCRFRFRINPVSPLAGFRALAGLYWLQMLQNSAGLVDGAIIQDAPGLVLSYRR